MREIEFVKTKEKIDNTILNTIKINNTLIHSKYYPLKEAEKTISSRNLVNAKTIGVLGLGLGYHIYEILKKNENCFIYVFDVLSDSDKSKLYKDKFLKMVIDDERVKLKITSSYSRLVSYLKESLNQCDEVFILKSYMNILKAENLDLYNIFMDFEAQRITNTKFKRELEYNIINNESLNMKSINEFYNAYMKNYENIFIVAAGPSLNECTTYLKEIAKSKNNFIIAVGTAVGTLKNQGVNPNAVCILDPLEIIYKQLEKIKDSKIPLLVAYSASHRAAKEYNGPKYIYYNYIKDNNIVIECTNSVATAALSIAIKANPKRIFFIGQDLAYVDNKVHSDNTINGEEHIYVKSDNDFVTQDVLGNYIYTSKFYLDIKKWIERTIVINSNIEFINTGRGANIIGCNNIEIHKILEYLI